MTKSPTLFSCRNCGAQYPAWQGRCSECGQWGTIQEETATTKAATKTRRRPVETVPLADVQGSDRPYRATGIAEFDRVLSGGIVGGSLLLLGGNPGIGKSTLILQVAAAVAARGEVLYVSGEESKEQLKLRYDRLGLTAPQLKVLSETDVETIVAAIESSKPQLAVVDSIQTVTYGAIEGEAGGVTQIKASTVRLLETAKTTGSPIVLIGHVTKEGFVAGPKTLEHLVDTVLYLEGEDTQAFRLLRTEKNRFGVTDEVGVFSMTDRGLAGVANPSDLFLLDTRSSEAGSSVTAVVEGTRPFLVEVQALVSATAFGYPRRLASGFDRGRLELLIAVLTKRAGLALAAQDVHVNLVGGLKVKEPAIDLAVALAVASGLKNQPLDPKLLFVGELGLGGEVRPVARMEQRLSEAAKLGFTRAVISASGKPKKAFPKLTVVPVRTVADAIAVALPK
ncbi:MAG: DNA repair protein RadA [Candidatus Kerfeldbacteria bacterium]|nr:DNA repair protein RadA [Candidatus Kerfeldbacteria bacterium]